MNIIAFLMIFLWVPETKHRTLEELDYICKTSPLHHGKYMLTLYGSRRSNQQAHEIPSYKSSSIRFQPVHTTERRGLGATIQVFSYLAFVPHGSVLHGNDLSVVGFRLNEMGV